MNIIFCELFRYFTYLAKAPLLLVVKYTLYDIGYNTKRRLINRLNMLMIIAAGFKTRIVMFCYALLL